MTDAEDLPDPARGVFDTLLVREGRAVDLGAHVARLTRSVVELYDVPVDVAGLEALIRAEAQGLRTARVRTSYDPGRDEWAIDAAEIEEPGLEPRTLAVLRLGPGLGAHKWVDRRLVAAPPDADDLLLLDDAGLVLECGAANVFAVIDGTVVTPPLDGRILPGTVRARALDLLRSHDVEPVERALPLDQLAWAAEVFTTSSIRGAQPVAACLGVATWPVGPVTGRVRAGLDEPGS